MFQSTFPHGERHQDTSYQCRGWKFQSTFPHGERQIIRPPAGQDYSFNPRSRTGNDGSVPGISGRVDMFQSTFPHGERPLDDMLSILFSNVSIHVPARGTTMSEISEMDDKTVSIHVPARGTTDEGKVPHHHVHGFNPRSRTGNDDKLSLYTCGMVSFQSTFPHGERRRYRVSDGPHRHVSIHVPARGTTMLNAGSTALPYVSIHVPARGTTFAGWNSSLCHCWFQSTFPHGERPKVYLH